LVGTIAGTGELFGFVLRLASGRLAVRTGRYWLIALLGYLIQMAAVPAMAFAGVWWAAALLIVVERTGKALRNPAANTMMSKAGEKIGQGWAFGLHELLDQAGALAGPLITAFVLARHGQYRDAFLWLGAPALLTMISVLVVAARFPFASHLAHAPKKTGSASLPHAYWLYAASAALVAFGFADWPLIAYHFAQAHVMSAPDVPILYAAAMAASGLGALVFGRLFDARGFAALVPVFLLPAAIAPLVFLGGHWAAIIGSCLWGLALGFENSVMTAGVAQLVPDHARARAFGLFSAIFGIAWFLGSALMGALYDYSFALLAGVSVAAELVAIIPLLIMLREAKA